MKAATDIADLLQINKMLSGYINKLIVERAELYNSFIDLLNNRAAEFNSNKIALMELLKEIEWDDKISNRPLLKDWKRSIKLQPLQADDPATLEFEYWLVTALEAYKTALNATFLTNAASKYILMDQKCFLQAFLLDLIKHRELYAEVEQPALSAYS